MPLAEGGREFMQVLNGAHTRMNGVDREDGGQREPLKNCRHPRAKIASSSLSKRLEGRFVCTEGASLGWKWKEMWGSVCVRACVCEAWQ